MFEIWGVANQVVEPGCRAKVLRIGIQEQSLARKRLIRASDFSVCCGSGCGVARALECCRFSGSASGDEWCLNRFRGFEALGHCTVSMREQLRLGNSCSSKLLAVTLHPTIVA